MPDALENQLMLQRLFAPTTEPLERLGQGQLALAQQNMLRQQALSDQARAIIEAGRVRKEDQTFQTGRDTAQRTFTSAENKAQREHQSKLLKDQEEARAGHQKEYLREHARLEKELKEALLKGQIDSNTGAFDMVDKLSQHEQQFIDNAGAVDRKTSNQIVRQVVEGYKQYGKNTKLLDKFLDPNNPQDISLNLAMVIDPKDITVIRQDISKAISDHTMPQRVRAAFALENIQSNNRLKAEILGRPGGIDVRRLVQFRGAQDESDMPEELRTNPGGSGGSGGGSPLGARTPAELNRILGGGGGAGGVMMGPPAPGAAGQVPPELAWTMPGLGGPPGIGAAISAMGPPIAQGAGAAYSALMNPMRSVGGVVDNLNQTGYDMLQPKYNPVPVQFPSMRLPNVQNMADAIAPYTQTAKPLFGDPLQGFKDWQYQGIYNALAPSSDTGPDMTIPPKLFIRMRQIAMREGLTDNQITEGLALARQGDPTAGKILNRYKQLAIQSLAVGSQFLESQPDQPMYRAQ